MTEVDQNPSNAISLDFHVDPQFVNRTLASQSLGVDQDLPLGRLADNITEELLSRRVVDLRVAAIKGELGSVRHQIVRLRSAMYFKYLLDGSRERCRFHYNIGVDDGVKLNVTGFFDPARFEATSPRDNLSRQRHVYVAGIATAVNEEQLSVEVRPLLIGFPYFVPSGSESGLLSAGHRSELHYSYVDQFRLTDSDMMNAASNDEIQRLFRMSEAEVKKAFASILGVSLVPKDWPGEYSDLTAEFTIEGIPGRAAFAFKGPAGKRKPWTLHPSGMGKNGDQGIRLFREAADVMVVQHCGPIASSVHHLMDALSVTNKRRYMAIDADATVRILRRAGRISDVRNV